MITQAQIEKAAGIDKEVAKYMMIQSDHLAKNAMNLLNLCVSRYENIAFTLLKEAVKEIKKEINKTKNA